MDSMFVKPISADVKSVLSHVVSYLNKQNVNIAPDLFSTYAVSSMNLLKYINVSVTGLIMEYYVVDRETLFDELRKEVAAVRCAFFTHMFTGDMVIYDFKTCVKVAEQLSIEKEPSLLICKTCGKDKSKCSICGQRVYNNYWLYGDKVVTCYYRYTKQSPCSVIAQNMLSCDSSIVKIGAHCSC